MFPDDRCCDEDFGGSHYHCANCGKVSGMLGNTSGDSFVCEPKRTLAEAKRDAELALLIAQVRALPPPTERQRQESSLSFAYGNLAMSTNHKPCRNAFEKIATEKYGWSKDEFDAWADTRTGWRDGSP